MAQTGAAVQAELSTSSRGARIIREYGVQGTLQHWTVVGDLDAGGRVRNVATTAADDAATQAAAMLTALRA